MMYGCAISDIIERYVASVPCSYLKDCGVANIWQVYRSFTAFIGRCDLWSML